MPKIASITALVLLTDRPVPNPTNIASRPNRVSSGKGWSCIAIQYIKGGPMALSIRKGASRKVGLSDKVIGRINIRFSSISGWTA